MEFVREMLQRIHVSALAVQMNREQRAKFVTLAAAQKGLHPSRIKIECARIDIGKHRTGAGPRDSAGGSEEAERSGENLIARLHTRGDLSQQQGVGAGGATYRIARSAELRQLALKRINFRPQNVMLRSAH